ncbi:MAG: hypothetical protein GY833_25420 [Aestuariibacter sp.]|nr:hypothetical protein [Aestuariibacter sp.]
MSFLYKCYRDLKSYLGKLDALVELNELAIRSFKNTANSASNLREFIEGASIEYGINVQFESFPSLSAWASQYYVVAVHEAMYLFLYEYRREFVIVRGLNFEEDWPKIDGDKLTDVISQVERFCEHPNIKQTIGETQLAIFEYYHFLRNRLAHLHTKKEQELNDKYEVISEHRTKINQLYKVEDAPNHLENLCFSDFYIFTRAAKDIANKLSEIGQPTPQQIVDYIGMDKFIGLKKFTNNPGRKQKFASNIIQPYFGQLAVSEIDCIISLVQAH